MNIDTEENLTKKKPLHFSLLLVISIILYNAGYVIHETFSWSDPWLGFMNGMFHTLLFTIAWCITFFPWSILVVVIYRWRKWERYRTLWVLGPIIIVFLSQLGTLVFYPPTASNRFRKLAGTSLPEGAKNLQSHMSGGGIADYSYTYYFKCKSEDTINLIKKMQLTKDEDFNGSVKNIKVRRLPNCPDFSGMEGLERYYSHKDNWSYSLLTDFSKTEVYVSIWCY